MSKKVKIILHTSMRNLGKVGDIINVKMGYYENYLSPNKYASRYSKEIEAKIQQEQQHQKEILATKREEAAKIVKYIEKSHLSFVRTASGTGVLFGSVELKQIKKELENMINYKIRKVELKNVIKTTGIHEAIVDVFEDQHAILKILVDKSEDDLKQLEYELKRSAK